MLQRDNLGQFHSTGLAYVLVRMIVEPHFGWGLGSNGTENGAKAFSFVDSSEFPGVIRAGGHPQRGPAPKGATRAATGRPTTDRNPPL
jgi:hypothetical protein